MIFLKSGVSPFLRDLKENFPKGEGKLPNEEIISRLEKMAPGFKEWARIFDPGDSLRITELDNYWNEMRKTVKEGDIEGLVSGDIMRMLWLFSERRHLYL